jgi:hypothetical protein
LRARVIICLVPKFEEQVIDNNISIGYGLALGDVDGDGKPDILLADKKQFVWYRNGDWKRFVMVENLTSLTMFASLPATLMAMERLKLRLARNGIPVKRVTRPNQVLFITLSVRRILRNCGRLYHYIMNRPCTGCDGQKLLMDHFTCLYYHCMEGK